MNSRIKHILIAAGVVVVLAVMGVCIFFSNRKISIMQDLSASNLKEVIVYISPYDIHITEEKDLAEFMDIVKSMKLKKSTMPNLDGGMLHVDIKYKNSKGERMLFGTEHIYASGEAYKTDADFQQKVRILAEKALGKPLDELFENPVQLPDGYEYEGNGYYSINDIGWKYAENLNKFDDFLDVIVSDSELANEVKRFDIGDTIINIKSEVSEDNVKLYVNSVEAFGRTIDFSDKKFALKGDFQVYAFEAGNYFVLATIAGNENDKIYVISKDETVEVKNPSDADKSSSVVRFYKEEDELCYVRIPHKYYNVGEDGGVMQYCVSMQELYKEFGKAEIVDGNIKYTATMTLSLEEAGLDLQKEFKAWCGTADIDTEAISLDDYLKENAIKYTLAK